MPAFPASYIQFAARHPHGLTADAGVGDLSAGDVEMEMDRGGAAHLDALFDQKGMVAVDELVEKWIAPERAATAAPVAGSSAIPMSGANMRV